MEKALKIITYVEKFLIIFIMALCFFFYVIGGFIAVKNYDQFNYAFLGFSIIVSKVATLCS